MKPARFMSGWMARRARGFGPYRGGVDRASLCREWSRGVLIEREGVRSVRDLRLQELTKQECFELLAGQHLGRVVLVDDLGPLALPITFVMDRHTVLFRTDEGTKLEAASRGGQVAFEVDGVNEATRMGWSVLVRGEAVEVTDPAELARVRKLALYPWAPGAKGRYVRILPAVLTGRRIALPEDAPWTWWG
jgi:nitroimidazol reductase NimA-like FMN-containing flavoprotein (pyridoxamine 5'-phosphate oxidase superfamily)